MRCNRKVNLRTAISLVLGILVYVGLSILGIGWMAGLAAFAVTLTILVAW